jgi:hypothetical protein
MSHVMVRQWEIHQRALDYKVEAQMLPISGHVGETRSLLSIRRFSYGHEPCISRKTYSDSEDLHGHKMRGITKVWFESYVQNLLLIFRSIFYRSIERTICMLWDLKEKPYRFGGPWETSVFNSRKRRPGATIMTAGNDRHLGYNKWGKPCAKHSEIRSAPG